MNDHRYTLEPYKGPATRYRCPSCEQGRKFARYIDFETKEYLHPTVGRCDRETNCGYHYKPKEYFADNNLSIESRPKDRQFKYKPVSHPKIIKPSLIPFDVFKSALGKDLNGNNFVKYLVSLFGEEETVKLIEKYYITTSKLWPGANVFWQIDIDKKIRTGKIMLYDSLTGKRVKEKNNWVHRVLKLSDFNLRQCFFGEHLLSDKNKTVAIVESDKTAVIMSYYLPQYLWLSCSGKKGLNEDKFNVLKSRTVILFPDLSKPGATENCFEYWSKKAKEHKSIVRITVSEYLERIATDEEKTEGLDIADYYIKYSELNESPGTSLLSVHVREEEIKETATTLTLESVVGPMDGPESLSHFDTSEMFAPAIKETWNNEIIELEEYFNSLDFPIQELRINSFIKILNVPFFIESHFSCIKANNGNERFLPYLNRLQELKQYLIAN